MSNNQDSPIYNDCAAPAFADSDRASKTVRDVPIKLKLHICLFSQDESFVDLVKALLSQDTYELTIIETRDSLIELTQNQQEKVDCLVLADEPISRQALLQLRQLSIFVPVAIALRLLPQSANISESLSSEYLAFDEISEPNKKNPQENKIFYHPAEIKFNFSQSEQLTDYISLALTKFLTLTPRKTLSEKHKEDSQDQAEATHDSLTWQQRRLTEKLKERLGYLGVYYKRNSQDFYQNLSETAQKQLYQELAAEYRHIILNYFEEKPNLNQIIDRFVNLAFFSDISVSKILEIHMELMDEFAQQLKIEGRSEDILLDYRLALIDIVAHLCEMYRRSIPRDDIPLDVLFK